MNKNLTGSAYKKNAVFLIKEATNICTCPLRPTLFFFFHLFLLVGGQLLYNIVVRPTLRCDWGLPPQGLGHSDTCIPFQFMLNIILIPDLTVSS